MEADSDAAAAASSKPKKSAKVQHVATVRKNHLNIVFIGHVGKYRNILIMMCTFLASKWWSEVGVVHIMHVACNFFCHKLNCRTAII